MEFDCIHIVQKKFQNVKNICLVLKNLFPYELKPDKTTNIKKKIQSNSNIVESNIVENSNIVDDLAATKDFYLIKIQNSRNPK